MKLNEVFSGGFLKAEDLHGKSPRVKIESVEVKEFDDGKKLIIHFSGKDKALVCNKTNSAIIQEVLGSDDTDDWEGKTIQLCVKKVEFSGKLVPPVFRVGELLLQFLHALRKMLLGVACGASNFEYVEKCRHLDLPFGNRLPARNSRRNSA